MKHEHVVPLSRQAVALLRQVKALTGHRRFFVFSCSQDKPISDNTLNTRLRHLGYDTSSDSIARTDSAPRSRPYRMANVTATEIKCGMAT